MPAMEEGRLTSQIMDVVLVREAGSAATNEKTSA